MSLPYETATAGDRALIELQRTLAKFGCQSFGTMIDAEKGATIVQFKWRNQVVALHASWKGYAQAWLKENPFSYRMRGTRQEHEHRALVQAQKSVCSVLRDWVKGQVTAVECGVMSFEAAFMPHMLLPDGRRLIDRVRADNLLPAPELEKARWPAADRSRPGGQPFAGAGIGENMSGTCGTCKYRGENIVVNLWEEKPAKTRFFLCALINHVKSYDVEKHEGAAYVADGSDYRAALCVDSDFGCVKLEAA